MTPGDRVTVRPRADWNPRYDGRTATVERVYGAGRLVVVLDKPRALDPPDGRLYLDAEEAEPKP